MNILVTGGAGFVGSHLVEKLLEDGHKVTVIDDLSTGRIDNIRHLTCDKNLTVRIGTILNEQLMSKLVSKADFIYHLAAAVGVKYVIENPLRSIQTNVKGTEIVLELAEKLSRGNRRKKVLITSTSEVYGKNEKIPFKETDDRVMGPTTISRWSYSCAKAMDEFLALAYWREKRLPVIIVRLFNTCGPRQVSDYGMVIPRFIEQALRDKPLTVYGDGRQTRSFLYVDDAVRAIVSLSKNPKAVGEIFNIGSSERITIAGLASRIVTMTGSRSAIKLVPYEKVYTKGFEDMRHRFPNTAKIHGLTGFRIRYTLKDTLENMIEDARIRISKGGAKACC
ncbi:nucleoside-diphosphate sugar epimerase [Candidatus Desantisbacteria bacterium CG_4_10_14_0_8_um_filter_48_22]|uniref:UDP-glucuronate decarboxylase n=1 Tax=Candidatus Desantisbacteria bacterium CG_4_10_14_0_8_um_filter_48_22 TaxID=1974543 RepID=A0A2M7S8X1_9BACT|nr:MAG: nucleoside-diphosphate sugar epimerase [Candidatus Desantisbacteria bacterium CG1_02_49_89]PIV54481.1 MAG: nucleoside-diphosphate sugar epimerase [Candidatus Desantisbacteria bacterium CG02_land_8_20_14_3_00_49_13]PIZ15930.1 MAG: nucleoside-diphosphate sugar epimerase [Candidatus Desantisbacteria bacterium CG_4_10_14_0_8_um_filter_48_22]PJB27529.1 MAG: nucleoside-diphosphate sugar epimerase [Candidatus Desantisbacteria bacterium CG_4_9_14_3_um_filter_50_7]